MVCSAITLLMVLIALFSGNATSIYDPAGKSADQLINESRGIFEGTYETPQESRKKWSKEYGINFTMPSKLSGNSTTPEASRSSASAGGTTQFQTTNLTGGEEPQAGRQPASSTGIAGTWSFELRDSKTRQLALNLFQSEDAVFGIGTINDGGDTQQASASGSLEGDKLDLDVTSSGTGLYRLTLTMNGNTLSGDYRAFSTDGEPWKGIANGIRTEART